jgi:hypothetical protein
MGPEKGKGVDPECRWGKLGMGGNMVWGGREDGLKIGEKKGLR